MQEILGALHRAQTHVGVKIVKDCLFKTTITLQSLQAFAWFNELLVEHAETFWDLFGFDMDSALDVQPTDSWDSFPLFQLLNDHLCADS